MASGRLEQAACIAHTACTAAHLVEQRTHVLILGICRQARHHDTEGSGLSRGRRLLRGGIPCGCRLLGGSRAVSSRGVSRSGLSRGGRLCLAIGGGLSGGSLLSGRGLSDGRLSSRRLVRLQCEVVVEGGASGMRDGTMQVDTSTQAAAQVRRAAAAHLGLGRHLGRRVHIHALHRHVQPSKPPGQPAGAPQAGGRAPPTLNTLPQPTGDKGSQRPRASRVTGVAGRLPQAGRRGERCSGRRGGVAGPNRANP